MTTSANIFFVTNAPYKINGKFFNFIGACYNLEHKVFLLGFEHIDSGERTFFSQESFNKLDTVDNFVISEGV